jgi:uncharacterized membrane protein
MRVWGGFRLLVALLILGAFAAVASGAYSAGYVAGAGTTATNTSPWVYGGFYGISGIVGLIVTIIILVIILRILSLIFWHRDPWGSWTGEGPRPGAEGTATYHGWYPGWHHGHRWYARQAAFEEWHRRAHESRPEQTPNGGATGGPANGGQSAAGPSSGGPWGGQI